MPDLNPFLCQLMSFDCGVLGVEWHSVRSPPPTLVRALFSWHLAVIVSVPICRKHAPRQFAISGAGGGVRR